jgi:phosphatidylglycerol lysyltransferase
VGLVAGVVVFAVALYALRKDLASYDFRQVRFAVRLLPPIFIVRGSLFAVGAYTALMFYDALALRYVGRDLPPQRIAFVAFVAYAFSNALGFPLILGGGLRYRLYTASGLSTADIAMTIAFNGVTFWSGALTVAGVSLLMAPVGGGELFGVPLHSLRPVGALLLLIVAGYVALCAYKRKPIRRRWPSRASTGCWSPPFSGRYFRSRRRG